MGQRRSLLDFQAGESGPVAGGRFDTPAFHRNVAPILDVLRPRLAGRTGNVLEIGSGSGQHAVAFAKAFPPLIWWPSDPVPAHLASIAAWRDDSGAANMRPPVLLDAESATWAPENAETWPDRFDAVVAINVLHIAPWAVSCGLLAGSSRTLGEAGMLFVYGPFKREGAHTAPSNAAFDARLRAQDPAWGVRDVSDLEAEALNHGLKLEEAVQMPANNQILIFGRV